MKQKVLIALSILWPVLLLIEPTTPLFCAPSDDSYVPRPINDPSYDPDGRTNQSPSSPGDKYLLKSDHFHKELWKEKDVQTGFSTLLFNILKVIGIIGLIGAVVLSIMVMNRNP